MLLFAVTTYIFRKKKITSLSYQKIFLLLDPLFLFLCVRSLATKFICMVLICKNHKIHNVQFVQ